MGCLGDGLSHRVSIRQNLYPQMSLMASLKKQVADLYSSVISVEEEFCIDMEAQAPDDRPIWKWMGYSRKDTAARSLSKLIEGVDFSTQVRESTGGRPSEKILFRRTGLKRWGMAAGTKRGRLIQDYFLECERRATQPRKPWSKPLELTLEGAQIIDARVKSNLDINEMADDNNLTYWQTHQKRNEEFWEEGTDSLRERAGIKSGSWHRKADLKTQMLTWYVNQKILEEAKAKNDDNLPMHINDVATVSRVVRTCLEPIEGKGFKANFMPKSISEERAARKLKAARETEQPTLF